MAVVIVMGLAVMVGVLVDNQALFVRHVVMLILGFIAMTALAQVRESTFLDFAPFVYMGTVALLLFVLFLGDTAKGASRWLDLPLLPRFQPSELLKITLPLMLAWYLREKFAPLSVIDVAICLVIIAAPVFLVYQQPDLGTAILIAMAGLCVVFVAGLRWWYVILAVIGSVVSAVVAWRFLLSDYQLSRITSFINPEANPLGAGWNLLQSKIALGSGGALGKGLGEGSQSKLSFLPEGHTDFILAVIGEELGFIGTATMLMFCFFIFARSMLMGQHASSRFARLAIFGIALMYFGYVLTNTMMVSGLLPVVGVPLPLVSYGGTSVITYLAAFGIVVALHSRQN